MQEIDLETVLRDAKEHYLDDRAIEYQQKNVVFDRGKYNVHANNLLAGEYISLEALEKSGPEDILDAALKAGLMISACEPYDASSDKYELQPHKDIVKVKVYEAMPWVEMEKVEFEELKPKGSNGVSSTYCSDCLMFALRKDESVRERI